MTEQEMRERIADLTKQLDEERARTAKLVDAVRDLAMGVPVSLWPLPVIIRTPEPPKLPAVAMYYACSFAPEQGPPTFTVTYTSTPPKGNEP
ncbi:MAG TPA: hypothetical protein VJ801_17600 [Polyangia bacterium]|nr:hypothetical protein [Polyangia bacterium]